MKRIIIAFFLAAIALLLYSCIKCETAPMSDVQTEIAEQPVVEVQPAPPPKEVKEPPVAVKEEPVEVEISDTGYVLRLNTAFYTLQNDTGEEIDIVNRTASLSLGEEITIGQERKLTSAEDGLVYTFAAVTREDGSEGFAFPEYIGRGENLSLSDIQAAVILQRAMSLKNEEPEKTRRNSLLESALQDYPDSVFSEEIQTLLSIDSQIRTEPPTHSFMFVNKDSTEVRNLPDMHAGEVTNLLKSDVGVTVAGQTIKETVVKGKRARWYHITSPVNGWVFGADLNY